jgi:hypothetical protein
MVAVLQEVSPIRVAFAPVPEPAVTVSGRPGRVAIVMVIESVPPVPDVVDGVTVRCPTIGKASGAERVLGAESSVARPPIAIRAQATISVGTISARAPISTGAMKFGRLLMDPPWGSMVDIGSPSCDKWSVNSRYF